MLLKRTVSNLRPELLDIGQFKLARLAHPRAVVELRRMPVDGIIVKNEASLKQVLQDDQLYLKPLFFAGDTRRSCDGSVELPNDQSRIPRKIEVLLKAAEIYQNLSLPTDQSQRLLIKLVRYLASRNSVLNPLNNRLSSIGYSYPLVEDMSIETNPIHIIKHLDNYSNEGYFRRKAEDKVNLCYECQGGYLNFSECCTKCNSLDLVTEELIHHFRCAYVGPQSDFERNQKLVCPKCDHQLKHIGIDYDKPSEIHTCRACTHQSQETKMKAKCVDCGKENELEQLTTYEIASYQITEKSRALAATNGQATGLASKAPKLASELVDFTVFQLIKNHESRKVNTPRKTSDITIRIAPSLLQNLNPGMQIALLEELAIIIKPYLNEHDLVTIDPTQNIRALLVEYEQDAVKELQDILSYNLNKMLCDNGWASENSVDISAQTVQA